MQVILFNIEIIRYRLGEYARSMSLWFGYDLYEVNSFLT